MVQIFSAFFGYWRNAGLAIVLKIKYLKFEIAKSGIFHLIVLFCPRTEVHGN